MLNPLRGYPGCRPRCGFTIAASRHCAAIVDGEFTVKRWEQQILQTNTTHRKDPLAPLLLGAWSLKS